MNYKSVLKTNHLIYKSKQNRKKFNLILLKAQKLKMRTVYCYPNLHKIYNKSFKIKQIWNNLICSIHN